MIKKLRECGVKEPENHIVVLSPYRAQCHLIREELAQQGLPEIPVMTIVKSQGRLIVHFCSCPLSQVTKEDEGGSPPCHCTCAI